MSERLFSSTAAAQFHITTANLSDRLVAQLTRKGQDPGALDRLAVYLRRNCGAEDDWRQHLGTFLAISGIDPMVHSYKLAGRHRHFSYEQKFWKELRSKTLGRMRCRLEGDWYPLDVLMKEDRDYYEAILGIDSGRIVLEAGGKCTRAEGDGPSDAIHTALVRSGVIVLPVRALGPH